MSTSFFVTSLILALVPGTGVIYTITTSLSGSRRQAVLAALGCTLGIVPHILAAILGISAVLNTGAQVYRIIRIIGILYLLYLGVGLLRSKHKIDVSVQSKEKPFAVIGKAILLNLLNPKLTLFFFSFLPQFIEPGSLSARLDMVTLSIAFMGITFVVFCLYGLVANAFRAAIVKSPVLLQRIQQGFGLILIGFAGKLALEK